MVKSWGDGQSQLTKRGRKETVEAAVEAEAAVSAVVVAGAGAVVSAAAGADVGIRKSVK
jgi:hypothetical protein